MIIIEGKSLLGNCDCLNYVIRTRYVTYQAKYYLSTCENVFIIQILVVTNLSVLQYDLHKVKPFAVL